MRRRELIAGGLTLPFLHLSNVPLQAVEKKQEGLSVPPIYISDMHFHSFFGETKYHSRPVKQAMTDGQATLISWASVGDQLWFNPRDRFRQQSVPKVSDVRGWVERELTRIKAHVRDQKLKLALTPQDVDAAILGDPHVVLSIEGTYFVDGPEDLQFVYDAGVRHLQLLHYIRGPLGDFQTQPPDHNRLTELGQKIVRECNRLGILVDLAHCAPATFKNALAASRVPVVYSHGSVTKGPAPHPGLIIWKARQLTLDQAKEVAKGGGVVGLWALTHDVGSTLEGYGDRLLQLADWLGDRHVAFGTDMNGLLENSVVTKYSDVRRVIERWQQLHVPDARIRRISSDNYARVLKQAMNGKII